MTEEERDKRDRADMEALLPTREGARFFARLLELCGVYRLSYEPGDTHATAFKEGQRNIGNIVMAGLMQLEGAAQILKRAEQEREVDGKDESKG